MEQGVPVKSPLRILHLEDSQTDAELLLATLAEEGITCEAQRVDTKADFLAALEQGGFDLIIADYSLPSFDGIAALALAREKSPEVPFILVSGTLGEELAIDTLQRGATDYILKQRLSRLVPSVQRALRELEERVERKRAEEALRQSEEQLRQSQKMEAIGRLAGGIAHDFNNLLMIILGYNELLLSELDKDQKMRGQVEETQKAAERAVSLVRQLLAFSRKQVLDPQMLDLNDVVGNLEKMLRRLIGEDIELITRMDPSLGRVKADPGQLEQVIMNLAVNARDAMPQGGKLTIETASVEPAEAAARQLALTQPGPYVKLVVRDTGCGMDAATQAHIFEPFFTTKEEGKGTGLGLSTVYGIVKQSGGGIHVQSAPGQGTAFTIYLPRIDEVTTSGEARRIPDRPPHGTETVLLVEDEQGVRTLVRDGLRRYGYTVLEARTGVEAFLISNQHPGSIHLLVTDVVMPGMSGREVAHQLMALFPNMKVLYISGYLDDAGLRSDADRARTSFLQKPFTPEALARKVRDMLDW
ncbi:MAG TPA: response regulator [Nitrospiraceae bacterium]|nr:response regulator [Nitrospiraceae bacterium]